ncbi:MAG: GAF domain-containing protein [Rhizobiales bacterium]|nr:GAF domain-containing protein [Hyphomicrobiales bacterium]
MTDQGHVVEALSNREQEVADAYATGQNYKEIARELGLSPTTVRSHLRTVYSKLGVTSKIELAQFLSASSLPEETRDSATLVAELALELDEAVRRERGLAKILKIISRQEDQLEPVIDAVLEHALEICEAEFGVLFEFRGDMRACELQSRNIAPAFEAWLRDAGEFEVDPATAIGRLATTLQTVNIADVRGEDVYQKGAALRIATADLGKARSFAAIPMMSGNRVIGAFTVYRTRVHPFNDRALELAQVFADQAVIAIENARRSRELQARLERAAATREILQVISRSRDDDAPVFEAIVRNVGKLCGDANVALHLSDQARTHATYVAGWGDPTKSFETGVSKWPLGDPLPLTDAIRESRVINIPDSADDLLENQRHPDRVEFVEKDGIRSQLVVPLLVDGQGIGCFEIYRREVKPFTDDEVALVEGFAAQAVIAIENVRQFKLLEARTGEIQALNASLEARVDEQVGEIERMGRLKRFLSPAVADALVTSGDEAVLASHRALIATLFCDIRGFTAFCETAEPEETIEVLQTYHEEMGNLISAHGGGVDKRMGDGIMVIFNDPLPCEDPAGDAVRLAVAMRKGMVGLCRKWKRLGHRLGFGVGISFGYATIGMVGSKGRYDYTASGTAVNLAARLCDRAEDGQILLSPRAYTAIEDDFRAESDGEVSLKGIREPVEVFKLEDTEGTGVKD